MIEVKPVHGHFPVGSRDSGEALFELLAEHLAVRKIGQSIVAFQIQDPGLRPAPFADVLDDRNPTSTVDGLLRNANPTAGFDFDYLRAGPPILDVRDHGSELFLGIAVKVP
jgi:hypothetical protein